MFQGSFKSVSWKFKRHFIGVKESLRVFQLRLTGVSISFKGVSRIFERSLKGVFRKFQWWLTNFQRSFKEVSREFQESFKGI